MTMTKAERAHVAVLEKNLAEALAFRRTDLVKPDVSPPEPGSGNTSYGFRPHVYETEFRAEPFNSTSIYHGRSDNGRQSSRSHGSIMLCSSRLLALQMARNQMERNFATVLAKIDAEMESERANPTPHPESGQ